MPMPGMVEGDMGEWFHGAKVNVEAVRAYAAAVFAATEAFIAGADGATLNKTLDVSFVGLGKRRLADVFTLLVVGHCDSSAGEISAIKGVFGLKGYPF
jgi:hypothetical protein